ncbi:MAG: NADH-quinone oxidoreductase subunit NuoG [Verrucomicrobia bacterium]|nr:NADH-quinone oxidoreductase subunit NuoG [Verrucomicrobiota bacterium]MBS0636791.1 NADH-quinone oxidoreductase subunit NuoG [Verrucomicrobiota bacterium]
MISLTIDNQPIQVPKGTTVYTAAKQLGIELPIFCYQDRMPPFGACRVCLVEVDKMNKLQTSCTLECTEGMVVRTQADPAVRARKEILEFLLINHPLDCPICDRGGECPLQDQALEFGPGKSRFFEEKRHFEKAIALGPVLTLDRERCITCARCTRFGDIVAGDHALEFIERGYKTEVGTSDGEAPKSKFIGNTIAICPVGALTSTVYRFRARPWDNMPTETSCTLCPVGCSMILDSRDGEIMRTRSQEDRCINDIWLCDKGWFGYEFSSSDKRLTEPLIRKNGRLEPVSWDDAFSFVASKLKSPKVAALGGNTLTVEENYLFQMLMRDVCGTNDIDHRVGVPCISAKDEGLQAGMELAIGDLENLQELLILGLDITEEFPILWLRLKQAINKGCKVTYVGRYAPEVARYFDKVVIHDSDDLSQFRTQADILIGSQYLQSKNRKAILAELLSWQPKTLNIMEGSGNSLGARFAGVHPEFGPQGTPKTGKSADVIVQEAWDTLYVVGADLASKIADFKALRERVGCLIVQDLFMTKTAMEADVVLPTLSYVEKGGSFLNVEQRIQKLKPGKAIPKGIYADSYIFVRIAQKLQRNLVIDEGFLQKLKPGRHHILRPKRIDAEPLQKTAGLVAIFAPELFDNGVRMQHNEQLHKLVKEPRLRVHPTTALKGTITVQVGPYTLTAPVEQDPNVAKESVVIPLTLSCHGLLNGTPLKYTN